MNINPIAFHMDLTEDELAKLHLVLHDSAHTFSDEWKPDLFRMKKIMGRALHCDSCESSS